MWLGYKKYSKKKTSMSYIEKDTGILWWVKYVPRRHTPTWEKIVNREYSGDLYRL